MKKYSYAVFLMTLIASCKFDQETAANNFSNERKITKCIGRTFADIPISFSESNVAVGYFLPSDSNRDVREIEILVSTKKLSTSDYQLKIRDREDELIKNSGNDTDVLRLVKHINENVTIFRTQKFDDGYFSELSYLIGETLVTARLASYNNEFENAEEEMIKFSESFKEFQLADKTKLSGFCVGDIVISGHFKLETAGRTFFDRKGTVFSIDTDTFGRNENIDLLSRVSGPRSLLTIFKVKHTVLRARELQVSGMRAQEWLSWARHSDEDDIRTHQFELETMRSTPGKRQPLITMTLNTAQTLEDGTRAEVSTPDKEAVRLWDSIVSSIRPAE